MKLLRFFLALMLMFPLAAVPVHAETAPPILSEVVKDVSKSVVGIVVVKRVPSEIPDVPPRLVVSSGSGFAIRAGGYILSNAHVLDHALYASVITSDNKSYFVDPTEIWADPASDLAVARIDAELPPVTWADPEQMQLGEQVFAMGAPYGMRFKGSVSRGIISGFERELDADYTFIQTDAPINPGNSGGPLFNMRGEVVGVNTRKIGYADGMGFAIPADVARQLSARLIADGKIERAWLGLQFAPDDEVNLGWPSLNGPMITAVEPKGPAARSGLQVGDTIVKLDQLEINELEDIGTYLRQAAPGSPVTLTYRRDGQEAKVSLTLGLRPHDAILVHRIFGLWTGLTPQQRQLARDWGRDRASLSLDELLDPWTTYQSGAKAVLYTEYLQIARQAWAAARAPETAAASDKAVEQAPEADVVEVHVDLPVRYKLGGDQQLWAEWKDDGGTVRALSVRLGEGARVGYQRLVIRIRSTYIDKQGVAVLVLHLDANTDRRFVFDLDQLH